MTLSPSESEALSDEVTDEAFASSMAWDDVLYKHDELVGSVSFTRNARVS